MGYFLFSYLFHFIADVSGQVREVELICADVLEIVFPFAAFIQPQSQNILAESSVRMSSRTKLQLIILFIYLLYDRGGCEELDPVSEECKLQFWGTF